ncbi:MAG: RNA polymerase sigma factor (sigma-70 family) [Cyclobacteriaceae bacterium]|jgi:RNA polymerase sigma-70 factor (ECF subfamily)
MTDRELVKKVIAGEKLASVALIQKHQRLVVHIVGRLIDRKEELEEVCQDIFIKVLDKLSTFNFDSKLSTWIATIAFRHSANHLKKLNRAVKVEDLENVNYQIGVDDKGYEKEDFASFIHSLIAQMPEHYRVILTLYHLDGFSYPEIVEVTGLPEGTVKNYLFRARKKLKEICEPLLGKEIHLD